MACKSSFPPAATAKVYQFPVRPPPKDDFDDERFKWRFLFGYCFPQVPIRRPTVFSRVALEFVEARQHYNALRAVADAWRATRGERGVTDWEVRFTRYLRPITALERSRETVQSNVIKFPEGGRCGMKAPVIDL